MQPEDKKPEAQPSAGWVFHPGDSSQPTTSQPSSPAPAENTNDNEQPKTPPTSSNISAVPSGQEDIHWTASEYAAHERGAGWYLSLALGAIVLAGLVYLLTRDYISSAMIIIVVTVFGAFALKRPRVLEYTIDDYGINIGTKSYPYDIFKSFSVNQEGSLRSLLLMPLKRFMPIISIYYAKEDEDKIVKKIADYLPFEEYRQDLVDKMMHKIRF